MSVIEQSESPDHVERAPAATEQHRFLSPVTPCEPPLSLRPAHTWPSTNPDSAGPHRPSVRSARSRRRADHPIAVEGSAAQFPSRGRDLVHTDARATAEQAMRILIEVLDRRRNADQLIPMFTTEMIDLVRSIVRNPPPGRRLGVASIHRIHLVFQTTTAAEIFGSYSRGPRTFAFAARIESAIDSRRPGWTVTSLRVG